MSTNVAISETNAAYAAERERLGRRIMQLDKPLARKLKYYRNRISKPDAVADRNQPMVLMTAFDGRQFMEGADVLKLCHQFLNENHIPALTTGA